MKKIKKMSDADLIAWKRYLKQTTRHYKLSSNGIKLFDAINKEINTRLIMFANEFN